MQSMKIKNLGPISDFEMEITKVNLLIGEQATGKSTISKSIYFFRSIKDELIKHLYLCAIDLDYSRANQFPKALNKPMKDIFIQLFGYSWDLNPELLMEYRFTDAVTAQVSLANGRNSKKYISISYSRQLKDAVTELEGSLQNAHYNKVDTLDYNFSFINAERARIHKEISEKINTLFEDQYETYYIPAGRQLLTLLASQKTKLDYDSIDLVNRKFMQFNESVQSNFRDGISNVHKFYPVSERKFDAPQIAKEIMSGLKGDYRVISGSERLVLKSGDQIPVNYTSSGQQELLWLYNQLYVLMLREEAAFVIIEEPEAHLYPTLQKEVVEYIVQFANLNHSQILVTTHSPYVLTTANVLYYAGRLGKELPNQVNRVLKKDRWITPDEFTAWKLTNDEGTTQAESLLSEDIQELRTSLIDDVSDSIGETYTKLFYIEVPHETA